jgi:hypothetical protein
MKMISAENAKEFLSGLENIFYSLHLDDATWNEFDTITEILRDDITEEIAIRWHIQDVQSIRPDLSDQQASDVLVRLKKNHDATVGINWDTIETVAEILFPSVQHTNTDPSL